MNFVHHDLVYQIILTEFKYQQNSKSKSILNWAQAITVSRSATPNWQSTAVRLSSKSTIRLKCGQPMWLAALSENSSSSPVSNSIFFYSIQSFYKLNLKLILKKCYFKKYFFKYPALPIIIFVDYCNIAELQKKHG